MSYLTYTEFQTMGGGITETAFNQLSYRAEGIINNATFNRLVAMQTIPEAVKYAEYDIINLLSNSQNGGVTSRSQSVGNVSESESYVNNAEHTSQIAQIIFDYLGQITDNNGTPILYKGVLI